MRVEALRKVIGTCASTILVLGVSNCAMAGANDQMKNTALHTQPRTRLDRKTERVKHRKKVHRYHSHKYTSSPAKINAQLAALKLAGQQLLAAEKADMKKKLANQGAHPSQLTPVVARGLPSVSLASPNAFGSGASIFAAVGYVNHWDGTKRSDGNFSAGASFGNAYKYVGVTLSWLADSTGFDDPFNKNGSLGFRINRYLAKETAVAFGMGSVAKWGALGSMSHSYYLALTQGIKIRSIPVAVNIGAGTGAFYSPGSMQAGRDDQIRVFGGVGVTVYKGLSLIMDYATEDLNAGATYVFNIKKVACFITAGAMNIAERRGMSPHLQLNAGVSYAFS